MLKNKSISYKLSVYILLGITLIAVVIATYVSYVSESLLLKNVEENAKNLTEAKVNEIEKVFLSVAKIPAHIARVLETGECTQKDLLDNLHAVVENNEEIYGSCIAFEPYAFFKDSLYYAPYLYKEGNQTRLINLGNETYQYFNQDWYQIPKERKQSIWSEPYFDEGGGNIMMATYSVPFYRTIDNERVLWGIVTVDISLEWVKKLVSTIKIYDQGYAFLISNKGTVLYHPKEELILYQTIFSDSEKRNDMQLHEIGRRMVNGETDFMPHVSIVTNENSWIFFAPLPSSNYSLGLVIIEKELFADLRKLAFTILILGIIGFILLLFVITTISNRMTKPLRRLAAVSDQIGAGNFQVVLPAVRSRDEIGHLTDSFGAMQIALNEYMENLKVTTAAKEKIESELNIAHDIQMGILPRTFPAFPEREDFDIYAIIEPAREVGGDFYDFFLIDDETLCIVIGDVSGKGVPAALFMAVTRTLIKSKSAKNLTPDIVLARVNEDLSIDNTTSMFATVFLAILNTKTGELSYSNGGHNIPYILRKNGKIEPFDVTSGIALGVLETFKFDLRKTSLKPGEGLYLYTDGINEAEDPEHNLYENKRIESFLREIGDSSAKMIAENSLKDVKIFTRGAAQSDDITIVVLNYTSSPKSI